MSSNNDGQEKASTSKSLITKNKAKKFEGGWPDVEIFDLVVPPKQVDLQEFAEYLTLKCNDGAEILVPKIVATSSSLWMRRLLASDFKEKQTLSVEFKEFSGPILEEILRFCIEDYIVNKPNLDEDISIQLKKPRVVFQFYIQPDVVMEMLMAADFLQIQALLELSSQMLAHYIDDVPSFAGIAPDLIHGVFSRVDPVKLCGLEDRPEYKALNIDTSAIWRGHCEKKDYKALGPVFSWDRNPMLKKYLDSLGHGGSNNNVYNNNNNRTEVIRENNNEISQNDEFRGVDWKRMYLERDLNLRLFLMDFRKETFEKNSKNNEMNNNNTNDNTNSNNTNDQMEVEEEENKSDRVDILNYIDDVAPYISYLKVTMSNFDLRPFNYLTKLELSKFPLTAGHAKVISRLNQVTDLLLTEMKIRDTTHVATILSALNGLSVLDLSDNAIDDNGIVPLSRALSANNSLSRLSISFNKLGGPAMGHIFSALKQHINIELLDLSHNNIFALDLDEDRYRDLKNNTSLKHLILDGNPLGVDLVHRAFYNFKLARHAPTALTNLFAHIPQQLLSLSLRSTDLVPEHIVALASNWATNTLLHIEFLTLANNEVRDEGAEALSQVLRVNRSLKVLDLTRCDFKQKGFEHFASCLQLNDSLEHFIIDRNKVGNTAMLKLVEGIKKNPKSGLRSVHFKLVEASNEIIVRVEEEFELLGIVTYSDSTPENMPWRYQF